MRSSFRPIVRPRKSPQRQIASVTAPMISDSVSAAEKGYSSIVKPTESASIEVATPWSSSVPRPSALFSSASSSARARTPSRSILPPM